MEAVESSMAKCEAVWVNLIATRCKRYLAMDALEATGKAKNPTTFETLQRFSVHKAVKPAAIRES